MDYLEEAKTAMKFAEDDLEPQDNCLRAIANALIALVERLDAMSFEGLMRDGTKFRALYACDPATQDE